MTNHPDYIKQPYFDEHQKRWIVETMSRTFRFNVQKNAEEFVLLWLAGCK